MVNKVAHIELRPYWYAGVQLFLYSGVDSAGSDKFFSSRA